MATLSGLDSYTKRATETYLETFLYSPSIKNFELQKDVQYKKQLRYATSDVTLQAEGCDLTATGNGTWTKKDIEVIVMQSMTKYCEDDFRNYALPYKEALKQMVELEQKDLAKKKDTMIWNGNTHTTGSTDFFDGFVYKFANESGVLSSGFGATALTVSNVDDAIQAMVDKYHTSEAMMTRGVMTIYMPIATYALYKTNRMQANYYHDMKAAGIDENQSWLFGYEGLIKVSAEAGLVGVDDMYMTWDKNLVIAMDERERKTYFKVVVDEIKDLVYLKSYTRIGLGIKYTAEVIALRTIS